MKLKETNEVRNYGPSVKIPTSKGNVFLDGNSVREIKDLDFVAELTGSAPCVEAKKKTYLVDDDGGRVPRKTITTMTVQTLRKIGASVGISGVFKMKKTELISILGG